MFPGLTLWLCAFLGSMDGDTETVNKDPTSYSAVNLTWMVLLLFLVLINFFSKAFSISSSV